MLEKIHQAFTDRKAIKIHNDVLIYVKSVAGTATFGSNPEKFENLVIRAAYSGHVPVDNQKNAFTLMNMFPEDIIEILLDINIDELVSQTDEYMKAHIMRVPLGINELGNLDMGISKDGTRVMRVMSNYSSILAQEHVQECAIIEKIRKVLSEEGRKEEMLHL